MNNVTEYMDVIILIPIRHLYLGGREDPMIRLTLEHIESS